MGQRAVRSATAETQMDDAARQRATDEMLGSIVEVETRLRTYERGGHVAEGIDEQQPQQP